jgi:DUF4097 and DUF4098 domain-containing protein YvlB
MRDFSKITILALIVLLAVPVAATAGTRIEKQLDLSSGGTFRLDTDAGSVSVVGASSSGAEVIVTSKQSDLEDHFKLSFEGNGSEARVKVERRGSRITSWFRSGPSMHFEIRVPKDVRVVVETSGGRIELEAIDGDVDLNTSGGSITVEDVRGKVVTDTSGGAIRISEVWGDVRADTSGGSISIDSVEGAVIADTSGGGISLDDISGNIVADTSGGSINIEQAGGSVRADTSGGPVSVAFTPGNSMGGSLSSSGGRVTARVDASANLDIDASTSGGRVSSDVPVTVRGSVSKSALRGQLNDGGAVLKLRSSGGGIKIESH